MNAPNSDKKFEIGGARDIDLENSTKVHKEMGV